MRNISGFVAEATLSKINGTPFSMPFKLSDNSIVMLDADQMIEVGKAVSLHGQRMYAKSWELKALADAATTTEELEAIDINAGWLDYWNLVTLSGMRPISEEHTSELKSTMRIAYADV